MIKLSTLCLLLIFCCGCYAAAFGYLPPVPPVPTGFDSWLGYDQQQQMACLGNNNHTNCNAMCMDIKAVSSQADCVNGCVSENSQAACDEHRRIADTVQLEAQHIAGWQQTEDALYGPGAGQLYKSPQPVYVVP